MTESEAKLILESEYKFHGECSVFGEALTMAINALEKQEKIKEAFEMWKAETGGYYGADDETTRFISTLSQILRSDDAIEIVKHGGVADDVCEWKSASDGEFIQNPHTKRLYSNEPSMQNVYCNTCGKKIKIVGD